MRLFVTLVGVLAAIWVIPFLLPVESGLKFGVPYRVFFSLIAVFGGFWFYLLRMPSMAPVKSTRKAVASIALVFVLSTGTIVLFANLAPQFAFEGKSASGATAGERGKALFNDASAGCFLCHVVAGSGGARGPDLSHVGAVAGNRRPGMSAEDYLKESLMNPVAFVVPPFDNIMPPFSRLSPEAINDLLAYLRELK